MNQQLGSHTQHISRQFNIELEEIKNRMLEMGGLVESQLRDALESIIRLDTGLAEEVRRQDAIIDSLEIVIDEQCNRILAKRQPAASDLRLILSIVKAIRDLERIGDEASKIAKMAVKLSSSENESPGSPYLLDIGERVVNMLHEALDAYARGDAYIASAVLEEDDQVDARYEEAIRDLVRTMTANPGNVSPALNSVWALRALERIGDHAKNISEHVLYLVQGNDVRHGGRM